MAEKTIKIYKVNGEFILERINEFNHATKRSFVTQEGLLEGLGAYQDVLDQYEIQASDELWPIVINFLNQE